MLQIKIEDDTGSVSRQVRRLSPVLAFVVLLFTLVVSGCDQGRALSLQEDSSSNVFVWGRRGLDDGRFLKPRAITIDDQDRLYIVDMTSRIQIFDRDGNFIRSWRTPKCKQGKPCGLSISQDGLLMVCDTHYFRVLFYTPEGELIPERTIGGTNGRGPGEFGFVTDVVQDSEGNYYVSEYGDYDRIQKFTPDGQYVYQWGQHGTENGHFLRPQGLAMDAKDQLWVADASNHRIQVFDVSGDEPIFVRTIGSTGADPGQLSYPYQVDVAEDGTLTVGEFGNHRIQQLDGDDGTAIRLWGGPGRQPGELHQPWAFAIDSTGSVHVVDSYNHRIQRFEWPGSGVALP